MRLVNLVQQNFIDEEKQELVALNENLKVQN